MKGAQKRPPRLVAGVFLPAMRYQACSPRLVDILYERAHSECDISEEDTEAFVRLLVEECELTTQQAQAVVAGESVEMAEESFGACARILSLNPELLGCLLIPTMSRELLAHTIVTVSTGQLDIEHCEICMDLSARIASASREDAREDLLELCADILDHTGFSGEEELFDEAAALATTQMGLPAALAGVLAQLEPEARARVMAYAYQELAQTTDGVSASTFAAYARLRSELAPLARGAVDILSQTAGGILEWRELVRMMPADVTVEGVTGAVQSALAVMEQAGFVFSERPLAVLPGSPLRLRLSPSARMAWRALVHAERLATA